MWGLGVHVSAPLSVCHITGSVCCSLLIPHKSFSWGIFRDGCYVSGTCHVISTRIGRGRNLGEVKEVRRAPSPTFLSLCFLIRWTCFLILPALHHFLFYIFSTFLPSVLPFVVFFFLHPVLFEVNLWTHTHTCTHASPVFQQREISYRSEGWLGVVLFLGWSNLVQGFSLSDLLQHETPG